MGLFCNQCYYLHANEANARGGEGEKLNGKYSQLTTTIACHGSLEKCSKKGPKKLKS